MVLISESVQLRLQRALSDVVALRASAPLPLLALLLRQPAHAGEEEGSQAYIERHKLHAKLSVAVGSAAVESAPDDAAALEALATALEAEHAKSEPPQRPRSSLLPAHCPRLVRTSTEASNLAAQPPAQQTWTAIEFLAQHAARGSLGGRLRGARRQRRPVRPLGMCTGAFQEN